ncbi:MAG TPA: bifunctional 2-C-methyl-D-erythritol 4-phosphate cytidylyltransferase/2-C-methyl-D-erythritol 2,4-cyclodiphosphate synthase [Alphaproteobacteria bacterium]|nr:bifunctional 2-C-methyl-D-erythritol 4-phosphate cytidylyltransferase/2-C-methyl-D-erythritol 2,4-cyclodiphosphate synthase [Alphaproteobacteria bacterium]
MPNCAALIVAAGAGDRFGGPIPKQYLELGGMPILRRSVLAFLEHPHIDRVQVVINVNHRDLYDKTVGDLGLPEPVEGGATRQDSVRLGLESMASTGGRPDLVMIHDAARPLIDAATITAVRKALDKELGAIAAKPLVDTLKRGDGETIVTTIDRKDLWQAHTPQAFRFDAILAAHQAAKGAQLTDDAAVAEKAGINVALVASNPDNMKITNPDDLDRATRLLGQAFGDVRTGFGYDVHRLVPGNKIFLGGIAIPHDKKLEGHSDADVVLHAVVDALLGALGEGDIGLHFPPSDPQWQGKDSAHFVHHAVNLVHERGGIISHVDVTLMCERPKIGPHREAMLKRLAALLDVTPDRVSVKATTTERLGFTGREEGIAAQAVATVRLPG